MESIGPWKIESPLGKGAFGTVYKARHPDLPGRSFALKMAPLQGAKKLRGKSSVSHAANLLYAEFLVYNVQLKGCPHILSLAPKNAYGDSQTHRWLAIELAEGQLPERMTWETLKPVMQDLIAGLQYMHERKKLFVDVNPGNVLFKNGKAKWSDFGLMEPIYSAPRPLQDTGTAMYMPSGSLANGMRCPATDLESLGYLMAATLIGKDALPWSKATSHEQARQQKTGFVPPGPLQAYFKALQATDPFKPDYATLKASL